MEGAPTDLAGPERLRTCDMETCPSGLRNLSVGVSPSPPLGYSNSKSILITLQLKIMTHL